MDVRLLVTVFTFCLFGQCLGHGEYSKEMRFLCFIVKYFHVFVFFRGYVFSQPLVVHLWMHWKHESRGLRVFQKYSKRLQGWPLLRKCRTSELVYKLHQSGWKNNWKKVYGYDHETKTKIWVGLILGTIFVVLAKIWDFLCSVVPIMHCKK